MSLSTYTGTFSAVDQTSAVLSLEPGEDAEIILTLTGSHAFKVGLSKMISGDCAVIHLTSYTANTASVRWTNRTDDTVRLRLRCITITATETIAYALRDTVPVEARELAFNTAYVDSTLTGWVNQGFGDPPPTAQLAQSLSGKPLYVLLPGLQAGDRIVGAYLVGNLLSAGNSVQISYSLLAISGASNIEIQQTAELIVTANTVLGKSNTQMFVNHTLLPGQIPYMKIAATTGATTTASFDGLILQVIRA